MTLQTQVQVCDVIRCYLNAKYVMKCYAQSALLQVVIGYIGEFTLATEG